MDRLRVLDTGVIEGRLNIALGQAIIEAHQAGHVPDTLRFLRFPPTALIGRHQALALGTGLGLCLFDDLAGPALGLAQDLVGLSLGLLEHLEGARQRLHLAAG